MNEEASAKEKAVEWMEKALKFQGTAADEAQRTAQLVANIFEVGGARLRQFLTEIGKQPGQSGEQTNRDPR